MAKTCLTKFIQLISKQESSLISRSLPGAIYILYHTRTTSIPKRRMSSETYHDALDKGPNYLNILERNPKRLKRIRFLGELFKSAGYELKIAGGAVRDLVNNIEPQDIDLATDAHPDETLKLVEKHQDLLRIIVTAAGQKHGTVAVKFKEVEIDLRKRLKLSPADDNQASPDGDLKKEPEYDEESPYEITTLRCDKLTDGRHADVEFINDWRQDAERRDLTINSMFLNLDDGKLIDYFGGEQDCQDHRVRFVGIADERIKEDYLRILRYFRFWLRFSRDAPDPEQLEAIESNLKGLSQISGERIWQELKKTFCHLPCSKVVKLMLDIKLFNYTGLQDNDLAGYDGYSQKVMQELRVVETNVKKYCDEYLEPKSKNNPQDQSLKRTKDLIPVVVFASCIQTEKLCLEAHKRLKFSNLERDTILYIIENRDKDPPIEAYKYQLAMTNGPERPQALQRIKAFLIRKGQFEYIDQLESWIVPQFPLSGMMVAKAVKEKRLPNSKTKEVIDMVKLEWAKGNYKADERELERLMRIKLDEMATKSMR